MEERTRAGGPKRPTRLQILMLSAAGFGVEVAYAVEAGYAIPAMLGTGLPETLASAMWAVGPVLGLLFQGYLGSASDRSRCAWGKRRPFILGLAVGACLALFLFPYGRVLSEKILGLSGGRGRVFVMTFTALTFVTMDFFLDAIQSPIRAYLLDSVSSERSERANYTYTALLSFGAMAGSLLSWIPWTAVGGRRNSSEDPDDQVEVIFGISAGVFAVSMLICVSSIEERNSIAHKYLAEDWQDRTVLINKRKPLLPESISNDCSLPWKPPKVMSKADLNSTLQIMGASRDSRELLGKKSVLPSTVPKSEVSIEKKKGCLQQFFLDVHESLYGTILFSKYMSKQFSQLWLSVFLNWVSYLSMYLFFTSFVGEVVYGGSPGPEKGESKEMYTLGVRVGCLVFVLQDIVAVSCCMSMKWLSSLVGLRRLYICGLVSYAVVCGVTSVWPTLLNVVLLQVVSGVVYSNLLSLPYTLISHYEVS